jgi:hypothetical protein
MNLEGQQLVNCTGQLQGARAAVSPIFPSSISPSRSKIGRKTAYESVNQVRFYPDVVLAETQPC